VLHSFCSKEGCKDGATPLLGGVVFDQAGNLYGTTQFGGNCIITGGCGVVFRLTPNINGEWTESVLYSFCQLGGCLDGLSPPEGLIFDQGGNLYGTTEMGGTAGYGVVFQLAPNSDGSWKEKVLHNFTAARSE
jgi:uncharacterized repeat protein (TIGR03803 family)